MVGSFRHGSPPVYCVCDDSLEDGNVDVKRPSSLPKVLTQCFIVVAPQAFNKGVNKGAFDQTTIPPSEIVATATPFECQT